MSIEDKTPIKTLMTYRSLSTELYDLDKKGIPEDEFAFYMSYVRESRGPILEPMCGSGRFLIPIVEAGFRVDGLDASSYMIDALYEKCETKDGLISRCRIWEGWLQDLDSPERYDLIFIPDGSFNLILNIEEVKICLRKIYEHLDEGGRFVFELVTVNYAKQIKVGAMNHFSKTRPDGKRIVQQVKVLPFDGQIAKTSSRYELIDEEGQVLKVETEVFDLFLHRADDIEAWLREVGFRGIKRLKAFDRRQVAGNEDDVVIFECIK